MKILSSLFLALGLVLPVFAQTDKVLVNTDSHGLALQGYDPVAFFTDHKPVQGTAAFQSTYHGGTYWFASAAHKALFDASPEKYEPAFGGYCAYGVSRNKLVEIDINAYQIVNGRLLMQYSKGIRDDFAENAQKYLAKADANWPGLVEKKGK